MSKATIAIVLVVGLFLLMLVSACAGDEENGSGNGPCAQRQGTYVARYTARSGNCSAGGEVVNTIDRQPTSVDPPCTGSIAYTSENCEVTYNTTCPKDGFELTVTGKAKWSRDATTGAAIEQWVLVRKSDGAAVCQGTFDVQLSRQ
jgi:hypothetical protein